MEIFKLFGSIFVDNEEANNSIAKTEERAEGLASKLGNGIKTAAKWGAGIAAGAGVAVGGMAALVGKTLETTSQISKFAQVTGMSTKGFQEWDYIAKSFGFSMEQAAGDMAALAERAMDASSGVGENADMFKELGVSVTDANGQLKSQEQLFNEVILGLQGMEDVTRRNAIATAMLSTTGEELAPVLNMTAEELANMKSEANIIDDEQLKKAEDFRLGWEQVKNTFGGVVTEVGIALMPMFQGLLDWMNTNMPTIQLVINTVFTALSTGIQIGIQWIQSFIAAIQQWYTDNEATFIAFGVVVQNTFNYIQELWNTILQPALLTIIEYVQNVLLPAFQTGFNTIKDVVQTAFNLIKTIWNNILQPVFNVIVNMIKTVLLPTFQFVFGAISSVISTTFNAIGKLWTGTLKPIFTGITDFISGVFSGNWSKAWSGIVSTFKGIFNGISTAVKTPLNGAIGMINAVIDGLNSLAIDIPDWVPGMGGQTWGVSIPRIPMLAEGGIITRPTLAMVGEGGESEAVIPLSKLSTMLGQQTSKQPIVIQLVTPDSRVLSEMLIDDINKMQYNGANLYALTKGVTL